MAGEDEGSGGGPGAPAPERRAAAAEAGHRGDVGALRRARSDRDPGVRATALGGLRRAGALDGDDLAAAVADPDPRVRRRAAEEVAALAGAAEGAPGRGPAAAVTILGLLDDPDPGVVETAAWASGERVPPEAGAVDRLAGLATEHDDALVREAAVAALGAIGDARALPAVLAATRDKATVRRRAVLALAPFDGPEVEAALARAADDRDWQVRQAAEDLAR
ncbi:HEAT repeat domain-containing protein [Iamia majanohamensis]|uniref:HEAT repeat domain-containing protein n=1 Tax=Iamia majanohamensis TaxID=467976 RepID=A0AAF0BW91_9ACTN|nr:HEAT repeat domain-containing protein [Iamia majanohamensis]WCO67555.1 HEAT repeat domain-containing protein [Iamia majanohamensis]